MDESYIHHNYVRHNDSLYYPEDELDQAPKPKHKGQRLCFIAGILDDGPDGSKLLATRVFRGGSRQTKDYHGIFNHAYFVNWMKELMDELDVLGTSGAVIVMDNASYHKGVPHDTPKGTWKKQDLLVACQRFGIEASSNEYRSAIWSKVQAHSAKLEVVDTPPYHSDLQPIEYVWAYMKGGVGQQYTTATTMEDVRQRLDLAFSELPSDVIYRCISHTKKKVVHLNTYLLELEAADEAANEPALGEDESSDDKESDDNQSILTDIVDGSPVMT
ncbi:hypothetical protein H257_18369 [Aphanomyces astaci]|uniref:Tc1-like transposase DDE domain-containing protein n=1 Tax=Aphanomyces astaci TaxID=112090 RepID=W4FDJ1_APHAT|nr:hypothetical protein H257_18369 [Aphanomyces astaci]ETV64793.1 hypothetical protein H257_18369 [Aphanomyces astaci]|eukprot:XP_009845712.1 hypothetical protein H257_18369 [Aphanomyces astaci]